MDFQVLKESIVHFKLYTLESSHFEHNGGLVQMIFLCKWVIFR